MQFKHQKIKETNGSDLLIKLLNKLDLKLQINFSRVEIVNTNVIFVVKDLLRELEF